MRQRVTMEAYLRTDGEVELDLCCDDGARLQICAPPPRLRELALQIATLCRAAELIGDQGAGELILNWGQLGEPLGFTATGTAIDEGWMAPVATWRQVGEAILKVAMWQIGPVGHA